MSDRTLATVICHYNPTCHPYLRHMLCLCVEAQRKLGDDEFDILICDGSPTPDSFLQQMFTDRARVHYLHAGEELSFGATYNLGIEAADSEFVALIANDVFISSKQLRWLVARIGSEDGCAIPYMTDADYATQIWRRSKVPRIAYPSSMTINANVFRRATLQAIGNVPESLSGGYNDAVIFARLRAKGLRIKLVDVGPVDHLRAITRKTSTNFQFERDEAQAPALAPALFEHVDRSRQPNYWARIYANSAQKRPARLLWLLIAKLPFSVRQRDGVGWIAGWIEPYLAADWRASLGRPRGENR